MGVGGCETKTIGYTCRSVVLKVFGPGFNSRRLHHTALAGTAACFICLPFAGCSFDGPSPPHLISSLRIAGSTKAQAHIVRTLPASICRSLFRYARL